MTAAALVAVAAAALFARELVVDASIAAETRVTRSAARADITRDDGVVWGAVAQPALTMTLDGEEARTVRARYAPQLTTRVANLGTPQLSAMPAVALLHVVEARGGLDMTRRLHVRASANAAFGDMDPATATATFQRTSGVLEPIVGLSYSAASADTGLRARLAPTLLLDVDMGFLSARALTADARIASTSARAQASLAWQQRATSTWRLGARGQLTEMEGRGRAGGATPLLGLEQRLGPGAEIDLSAGVGPFLVNAPESEAPSPALLPTVELTIRGGPRPDIRSRLEVAGSLMLGPVADPFGALLEHRAGGAVRARWHATRVVDLQAELLAFKPLLAAGPPPTGVVDGVAGARGQAMWLLAPRVALVATLVGTTRWAGSVLSTDVMAGAAIAAVAPVLHRGASRITTQQRREALGIAPSPGPAPTSFVGPSPEERPSFAAEASTSARDEPPAGEADDPIRASPAPATVLPPRRLEEREPGQSPPRDGPRRRPPAPKRDAPQHDGLEDSADQSLEDDATRAGVLDDDAVRNEDTDAALPR